MLSGVSISAEQRTFSLEAVFVLMGAIAVAACILVPDAGLAVGIACVALWFLVLVGEAVRGRIDGILLWWAGAFPLGYYFMAFPREHSIVNLDRVVILVAFVGLLLAKPGSFVAVPRGLRRAALAWFAFAAVSCTTLRDSPNAMNALKILFDSFLLPLLLGWCVIARFEVRHRLPMIHTAVCISSVICVVIAVAEIITGQDLLPFGGSAIAFAGSTAGSIPRPNGPFEDNDTLALIGTVSLFFLLFLRKALGPNLTAGRKTLHSVGLAAAIGMALMPMFRSVAITLLLVLIIDTFWEEETSRRAWRLVLILTSVGLILVVPILAPNVFEDRSRADNVYGRIAEYEQSLRVFLDHPVVGVGFQNFMYFVVGEPRYVASYKGVSSLGSPHSNVAQVLTETGILGFVPYVMAQVFMFGAIWQLRQLGDSGRLVWKYFFYMFLGYWISGLTLGSGYSPLNLWYVFAIAVSCRYALTEPALAQVAKEQDHDEAFRVPARVF